MSPPPLPLDHHIFISNSSNTKLDPGRIDLLLGLALHTTSTPSTLSHAPTGTSLTKEATSTYGFEQQQPSLTLSLLFPATTTITQKQNMSSRDNYDDISSFSNSIVSVKREKVDPEEDATVNEDVSDTSGISGGGKTRKKKLRLNKQQSALLEDSFKLHTTLNPKQKEALARQLNLRPRQVEVWFQNRRARTKLKQTEVDCVFLKKCCERLAEENEKLHKELQHLKSLKKQPFYMNHLPQAPTNRFSTILCPSCNHHQQVQTPNNNDSNNSFLISSKKRIFFNPFTKAC